MVTMGSYSKPRAAEVEDLEVFKKVENRLNELTQENNVQNEWKVLSCQTKAVAGIELKFLVMNQDRNEFIV